MDELAIDVVGLGKRFRISKRRQRHGTLRYGSLRDSLTRGLRAPRRWMRDAMRGRSRSESDDTIWALRDINFDVRRGEVLGVIGHNGSGKSTLLKILSRITEPSEGHADVHGRVGSLLEVGTGFHHELSGRENIYLNGAMLGMRRAEIERKFDQIVSFSQIGRFLDTPVKRYSSGMYLRLAFAVAAHLDTDILVLDEVLAVGDHEFQKRCLAKMREVTQTGRTVLFVSHSLDSVRALCDRAMLLVRGRIACLGSTSQVIDHYVNDGALSVQTSLSVAGESGAIGAVEPVRLHSVSVLSPSGEPARNLDMHDPVTVRIVFENACPGASYLVQIRLKDQYGSWVLSSHNEEAATTEGEFFLHRPYPAGLFEAHCRIPGNVLNDITYTVTVVIGRWDGDGIGPTLQADHVATFTLHDYSRTDREHSRYFIGPVRPELVWRTSLAEAA
jgi:homopolymeric O-antigen transport system ATP-binding protein